MTTIKTDTPYDDYINEYKESGHTLSNRGTYSMVFIKEPNRVNKLGILDSDYFNSGNIAYLDFIDRILDLDYDNIFLPKIYDVKIYDTGNMKYYDVEMEYLLPVTNPNIVYLIESLVEYDNAVYSVFNNSNQIKDLIDLVKILKTLFIKYDLDLSISNVMKRESGQIVICDPVK